MLTSLSTLLNYSLPYLSDTFSHQSTTLVGHRNGKHLLDLLLLYPQQSRSQFTVESPTSTFWIRVEVCDGHVDRRRQSPLDLAKQFEFAININPVSTEYNFYLRLATLYPGATMSCRLPKSINSRIEFPGLTTPDLHTTSFSCRGSTGPF
ncbi:uncharacterized protein BO95DRAFT_18647 [Aspergillus brunneoviolaceus CBS 621.78]|uniref:Uncharacterized protein n=1 Tax=Aspergillus brunneoviolaceus CBS 621.78 TaxID=1450534 RepID=A0ACD1FTV6_9EURO|nr:hypothetical protein BO95DRAFT_18647 [Aspergillus brunneoviolaceus CBS 621.78]RAH40394.1 hypothetical protein BO95DRAFT_18647 [Aspergillus brunneoviolaceus CBS 621.78]